MDSSSHLEGLCVGLVTDNPIDTLGGVERFSLSLVQELGRRGATVRVYDRTATQGFRPKWYDRFGAAMARRAWAQGWSVAAALRQDPVDVIIQNGISGWSLRGAAPLVPRIVVHHGTWRGVARHLLRPDSRFRTRIANKVLVYWGSGALEKWTAVGAQSVGVSRSVVQELKNLYGLQGIAIQNGIDLERFRPMDREKVRSSIGLPADGNRVVVGFTGRLEPRKGVDVLRTLAERSAVTFSDVLFLIATNHKPGGWPGNVVWLENVPYDRMPLIYAASDIFVFPSRYEGCSYSVIEAMACGAAPLLSNVGHAQNIKEDDPALGEFVLSAATADHFWPPLERLIQDADLRRRLGTAARKYAEQHNSLKAMGDAYERLIMELTAGGSARARLRGA